MPHTSTQEHPGEVHRDQPVRRLCRADVGDDGGRLVVSIGLPRFAARFGLLRYVWHPSLFVFAVYMTVLSSMVLVATR
jgi:Protein of unknown function (DUF1656)